MPILRIPNKGKWQNSNNGEYLGSIIQTYNGNLYRKQGKFSVSDRMYPLTTTADMAGIIVPTSFATSNSFQYAVAQTVLVLGNTGFTLDTGTPPTSLTDSDIINWGYLAAGNATLLVGNGTNLSFRKVVGWDNTYWTGDLGQGNALNANYPTILFTFGTSPVLYIANGNQLHSVATPGNASYTPSSIDVSYNRVLFPAIYTATWAKVANSKIYIGLKNNDGQNVSHSAVAEYDPVQETVNLITVDEEDSRGFVLDNVLYIVDTKGSIRAYNGQSFAETKNRFPAAYQERQIFSLPHRNGISVVEGKARFLLTSNPINPEMASGIWVYDPETGEPYLEYTMTIGKTNPNDFGATTSIANNFGALTLFAPTETLFAGAVVPLTATTVSKGVFANTSTLITGVTSALTRGWFITPKIVSQDLESVFGKLLVRYDPNDYYSGASSGTILAKYRMKNRTTPLSYLTGTWVNATSFTTYDVTAYVGEEVFIVGGQGAGILCHVLTVVNNSGTYTITIDETVPITPSGTFQYTLDNWIKLPTDFGATSMTNQNGYAQYVVFDVPADIAETDWIQFKVEVRGTWYVTGLQVGFERSLQLVK
jgi:hypothetical protein